MAETKTVLLTQQICCSCSNGQCQIAMKLTHVYIIHHTLTHVYIIHHTCVHRDNLPVGDLLTCTLINMGAKFNGSDTQLDTQVVSVISIC